MNIFEILPKDALKKLPKKEVKNITTDYIEEQKKSNSVKSFFDLALYVLIGILFLWGIFLFYFNLFPEFILDLIFLLFIIFSGGKMIIYGVGNMQWAPSRFGPWENIPLKGIGATIYGVLSFTLGLIVYILHFTPFYILLLKLFQF